MILLEHKP